MALESRKAAFLQRMAQRQSPSPLGRSLVVRDGDGRGQLTATGPMNTPRLASRTPLPGSGSAGGEGGSGSPRRKQRWRRTGPIHTSDPSPKLARPKVRSQQRTTFFAADVQSNPRPIEGATQGLDAGSIYSKAATDAARLEAQGRLRAFIRERNDHLRSAMRKHSLAQGVVGNLKQAQKQHNMTTISLVFERENWDFLELIERLNTAGDNHIRVMTAMMQQGKVSPIAVAEVQGLCKATQELLASSLQTLLAENQVTAVDGFLQAGGTAINAESGGSEAELFVDPLQGKTDEAYDDLKAAQKVQEMMFRHVVRKKNLSEKVVQDVVAAQTEHHNNMLELLLTHKLQHVEISKKLRRQHDGHAELLQDIMGKEKVGQAVAEEIMALHEDSGKILEDLEERSAMARKELLSMVRDESEVEKQSSTPSSTNLRHRQMLVSAMEEELKSLQAENDGMNEARRVVEEKLAGAQEDIEKLKSEKQEWVVEKKRVNDHLTNVHAELKAASEESVRLRRERADMESKYLRDKAELDLEMKNLRSRDSAQAEEIQELRKVVHDLHSSLKRLTDGARGAMNEAEMQADEMADEISRLKQDLILAKQYKLHTVMEKVTKAGMKEQLRLKRIIAHMQAEKLAMQTILIDAENQSDEAFQTVKRLSSKFNKSASGKEDENSSMPDVNDDEYAHINEQIALHSESRASRSATYAERARQIVERQMKNHQATFARSSQAVEKQYYAALSQIRRERDELQAHAQDLHRRENEIANRERVASADAQRERERLSAAAVALKAEHGRLAEEARVRVDTLFQQKRDLQDSEDIHGSHQEERNRQQKAHDLVLEEIVASHKLNHVVVSELKLVQRHHHRAMEELHKKHDSATISAAVRKLQLGHADQIEDILSHHNVHPEIGHQLKSVHEHHHELMHDLLVRQKDVLKDEGDALEDRDYLQAKDAPESRNILTAQNASSQRDDLHKSVQQVHAIVMEEVMKKHKLQHVAVGEMRVMQRSHEQLMNEILTSNPNANLHRLGKTRSDQIAAAQSQHVQLMQEIVERHGISSNAASELEAIHTHHHSLAFNLVHREDFSVSTDQKQRDRIPSTQRPLQLSISTAGSKIDGDESKSSQQQSASSPRKKSVEAVHHVHALVMEEVLAKHNVHPEAVEELRDEQEKHKMLLHDLLSRVPKSQNGDTSSSLGLSSNASKKERDALLTKAHEVQRVQENHKQLMQAIIQKHNIHHSVSKELEAVHLHHHAIVASLVKQHDLEDIAHHDSVAAAAAASAANFRSRAGMVKVQRHRDKPRTNDATIKMTSPKPEPLGERIDALLSMQDAHPRVPNPKQRKIVAAPRRAAPMRPPPSAHDQQTKNIASASGTRGRTGTVALLYGEQPPKSDNSLPKHKRKGTVALLYGADASL